MIKRVTEVIESDNILMFYEDRDNIVDLLRTMLRYIIYGKYYVNNVDDLVINLGCNGFVYDKSFLKMFEIFFKESFADIPFELWQGVFDPNCPDMSIENFNPPYAQYIKNELKMDIKIDKYIDTFVKYFSKIYVETVQCVHEKLNKDSMLGIVVTNECYAMLAHITFNLLVNLSKRIANEQVTLTFFNKSSRIQFKQVFSALMDCTPHNMLFSCSQRMMLHYILLSRKVLHESAKNCDLEVKDKKSTKRSKKKVISESDDESSEEEEEKEVKEVKKRRGRTPKAKTEEDVKKTGKRAGTKKKDDEKEKDKKSVSKGTVQKNTASGKGKKKIIEMMDDVEDGVEENDKSIPETITFNEVHTVNTDTETESVMSNDDITEDGLSESVADKSEAEDIGLEELVDGILDGI